MNRPNKHPCFKCGKEAVRSDYWSTTLVGFFSPPGHNHDDNCTRAVFICEDGHKSRFAILNKCPNPDCDWVGSKTCFCHDDEKIDVERG